MMKKEFRVDAYVDHADLEAVLQKRTEEGYFLDRMIELKPKDDREYVTLVWTNTI